MILCISRRILVTKRSDEQFDEAEAQRRFEAALRGARIAEAKPMRDMPRKDKAPKRKPRKAAKPSS